MHTLIDKRLFTTVGDITKIAADAMVNAANSSLLGGGGVDGAIHRIGGPSILEACRAMRKSTYPNGLPAGEAAATEAGNLPAGHVIHTVGPVWHEGSQGERETLQKAYHNSLSLAAKLGCRSVTFPNISTGVYRFPKREAAKIALETVLQFLKNSELPIKVTLVYFTEQDEKITLEVFEELLSAH